MSKDPSKPKSERDPRVAQEKFENLPEETKEMLRIKKQKEHSLGQEGLEAKKKTED